MGSDCKETGGRHPSATHSGYIVMNLLTSFLQKDVRKRITIDNAKRYPWFLNDILNPNEWLRQTSPSKNDIVVVTENETRTAMTTAKFTWGWHRRLTNRISSLFRNVRTPRPSSSRNRQDDDNDDDNIGVHSLPSSVVVERHKSSNTRLAGPDMREKQKRRRGARSVILRNESTPNMARRREQSIERWARSASKGPPQDPNSNVAHGTVSRRASETLPSGENRPHLVVGSSHSSKTQSRPSSRERAQVSEPSRHRFSLSSMKYWRPRSSHKTSQASSPLNTSSGTSISQGNPPEPGPSADIMARRSDEVLRHHDKGSLRNGDELCGTFTAARRASSWGEPMNYVEDVTSLNSGDHEGLDDDTMFLGAGGIAKEPTTLVSNLPWGLNQATEAISLPPPALRHPQPERLYIGPSVHPSCDTSPHDSTHNRHLRSTTASPSPLHLVTYESDLNQTSEDEYDEDLDSDSSFFRDTHRQRQREAIRPSASLMYEDADEEESDEETVPIEFKRRRASVSATAASPPPPHPLSDFSDDARSR
ncbi:hypothetical protein PAXINDRAFT_183024 [Paxillus involutus ATCC 200175]|uniref:Uncharacterized protein n=1 Tax=Paxillus involutus ATCC 200175 TaxID=664439 RepID=A0A0C9T0E9_PAXIN|nr:hypothetical protein PAXINDRAFT_183024 [Paxillus involutus ATCC 200175]